MTRTLKGKHLVTSTGAKNANGVSECPTKEAKMSWGERVLALYEMLVKIGAQRDQNMAHLLLGAAASHMDHLTCKPPLSSSRSPV